MAPISTSRRTATRLALVVAVTAATAAGALAAGSQLLGGSSARDGVRWVSQPGHAEQASAAESSPLAEGAAGRSPAEIAAPSENAPPRTSPSPRVRQAPASQPAKGAAPPAPPAPPRRSALATPESPPEDVEQRVVILTNAARVAEGCDAVTVEPRLTAAAVGHSKDMATKGYFAHESPEGATARTRVTAAGYRWGLVGENIAKGHPDAAAVVAGWLKSPGHRANIMNCEFRNIGVGMIAGTDGSRYWTQNFGTLA